MSAPRRGRRRWQVVTRSLQALLGRLPAEAMVAFVTYARAVSVYDLLLPGVVTATVYSGTVPADSDTAPPYMSADD
jgi:hypothetical protein